MSWRTALACWLVASAVGPALGAQARPDGSRQHAGDWPAAAALTARHDSLVGGRAALEQLQSIRLLGSLNVPSAGIEAPLEILKISPNRFLFRTVMATSAEILRGFDGTVAWSVHPAEGARILTGAEREQTLEQADFFGDLHDLSRFATAETVGDTIYEGRRAWTVRLVRASADTLYEYFDQESGLSLGVAYTQMGPLGRQRIRTLHGDYRQFGPLLLATSIVQRLPDADIVIRIGFVELDKVIDSDLALPDAVKALLP